MTVPVLLTERLQLDGHRVDDLDSLAAMWTRPEVYRFIGSGGPRPREEVWLRLLRSVGQWTLIGYGQWMLRDRANGRPVGEAGLVEARRAMEPPLDGPEVGWMLAPAFQGRGLAREALTAILDWAATRGMGRTVCIIDPANAASIRLAERIGFTAAGRGHYGDRPVNRYVRVAAGGAAT